ncbi:thiaminase/transcriptional activator TenA [Otariodibacter oris]|uniref:Aminopyrimidine aminohydrolase n=2 Tax=Otariodibacter oris TaxID=1032623 RepID=A0A420XGW7_9PAST|nr:thiaminase/transcriptional activator TenA [Otariodibacter oris]
MNKVKFSDYLIQQAEPYWQQATDHGFIRDMVDGTLDKKVFANYLVQDYAFVRVFADLIAYAIAYSKTLEQKHRLSTFLSMITSAEDDYFIRSFEALGVEPSHYLDPNLAVFPSIQGFHDEIKKAIDSGAEVGYANCMTIITCAEAVYCHWGVKYREKSPEAFYFNEWITLHNNDYFQSLVAWLKSEMDQLGEDQKVDREQLSALFTKICQLESQFFDESYL